MLSLQTLQPITNCPILLRTARNALTRDGYADAFKQRVLDMTYYIEKDDDDCEVLLMNAIIRNNLVEPDWPHGEGDVGAYAQRYAARIETFANADTPLASGSAFLLLRLYRRGDVRVSVAVCSDSYRDQAIRLARDAAIEMYDSVYPDVGVEARKFVEESIENVKCLRAVNVDSLLEAGGGTQLAADQFLPHLLAQAKAELTQTGEVVQRIGWLVQNGMALFPIGAPPFEKYRYFRAVAEVAKKVGADAVVYLSDGYRTDANGERTAEEVLSAMWINANATCVSTCVTYTLRRHSQLDHDIITFSTDISVQEMTQTLIPAWGNYRPD